MIKNIEMQDHKGDILHPHTSAEVVWLDKTRLSSRLDGVVQPVFSIDDIKKFNDVESTVDVVIPMEIPVAVNTIIRGNVNLHFNKGGCFVIKEGVTLTIESQIRADRNQIFKFETASSKVVGASPEERKPFATYPIYPEWFGCKSDAYVDANFEYLDTGIVYGTDSTEAFKRCMTFAESVSYKFVNLNPRRNQPSVTISFAPQGSYYCIGDNPLGVQSKIKDTGYFIAIEGNKSIVWWKPINQEDGLFGKYSRMVKPSIRNLNVGLSGSKGQRKGIFVNSKTYENDAHHFWSNGVFENLFLCTTYTSVGWYKIFNLEGDSDNSHDDQTEVTNVQGGCYKIYADFQNRESVGWTFNKIFFDSQTENAQHIIIRQGHSGGINFNDCEILLMFDGEKFMTIEEKCSVTPYTVNNARLEVRVPNVKLLDAKSGRILMSGLNGQGGAGVVLPRGQSFIDIGVQAKAEFKNCELFSDIRVKLATDQSPIQYIYSDCLIFDGCAFIGTDNYGGGVTMAYPIINYYNTSDMSLENAIRSGYNLRNIKILNPRYSNGGTMGDVHYSNSNGAVYKTVKINRSYNGYPKLNMGITLPPMICIRKALLNLSAVLGADMLTIVFAVEGTDNRVVIEQPLTSAPIYNKSLLGEQMLIMPSNAFNQVFAYYTKNGQVVKDENAIGNGWLELTYSTINTRNEITSDEGVPVLKDINTYPY